MFRLFRGLGLRHLIVVNEQNKVSFAFTRDPRNWKTDVTSDCILQSYASAVSPQVVGVVTRKDLAKYRQTHKKTHVGVQQLQIRHD